MNKISISELLYNDVITFDGDDWTRVDYPEMGGFIIRSNRPGAVANLRVPPEVKGLWLLRHDWSGQVLLKYDGQQARIDLARQIEDFNFIVPIDIPDGLGGEIKIVAESPEGRPANRSEVWILGAAVDTTPRKRSKINTLSRTTRLIEGDWGHFLSLVNDRVVPEGILKEGTWAAADVDIFKAHIKPGDCVIDVGAHIGHHSVVFSKLVGEAGFVLSIEAQQIMYELLNANCVINGAFNVRPVQVAASDRPGVLYMDPVDYHNLNNFGSLGIHVDSAEEKGEAVSALCVDDLVEKYCPDRRVAFIKIDVQAYEKYALSGLMKTIETWRPKIFLEIAPYFMRKAGYDYREIYRMLLSLGYHFHHFYDLDYDEQGIPDYDFDHRKEWDILAIPLERNA